MGHPAVRSMRYPGLTRPAERSMRLAECLIRPGERSMGHPAECSTRPAGRSTGRPMLLPLDHLDYCVAGRANAVFCETMLPHNSV